MNTKRKAEKMIGYIIIGSNELQKSGGFYDALLSRLGASRAYTPDNMIAYGFGPQRPMLLITVPNDGQAATHGNGTMIALMARDNAQVDEIHALSLRLGAHDDGQPAVHETQFYGGYFRDQDSNKFCIFVMQNT